MARDHSGSNIERSEYYGALQRIVDVLFEDAEEAFAASRESAGPEGDVGGMKGSSLSEEQGADRFAAVFGVPMAMLVGGDGASAEEPPAAPTVRRLDVVIQAEAADLPDDLVRIVNLIPPGEYTRQRLCDQLNSAITGHAWGQVYGTVE